ncbi:MAG TPA: class I SAM-dependent rRNA methyltransferase [Saprospiraceae bacterium]|nr:class I SAM-dependent rRNA methyltransferase [Saprospiraceae bacterium]
MKKIILKSKRDASIRRRHPWVFSGAIKTQIGAPEDGDTVAVYNNKEQFLAAGHFQKGSIMVRLLTFEEELIDGAFWQKRFREAVVYREAVGILSLSETNCFRLIHAEGDGLPGLIIDVYGSTAVVQCHSIGMYRALEEIATALREVLGDRIKTIYQKSKDTLPGGFAAGLEDGFLLGESGNDTVKEYGHLFKIDWVAGQKTGFFLDQRDNRKLLAQYAKGKKVLNTFCYTGGFSIYALQAGARRVDSVDASATAMSLTEENVRLNGFGEQHRSFTDDVMSFFKLADTDYELMIVDPPAFAKSMKKRHNAIQGYKRLNAKALSLIKSGGVLFTFSCSQVVGRQLFQDTIVAAALEAGRQVRIMHHLGQPADHPVRLFHPEGSYLKGLVLYVE